MCLAGGQAEHVRSSITYDSGCSDNDNCNDDDNDDDAICELTVSNRSRSNYANLKRSLFGTCKY